jgi:hypothetical protein
MPKNGKGPNAIAWKSGRRINFRQVVPREICLAFIFRQNRHLEVTGRGGPIKQQAFVIYVELGSSRGFSATELSSFVLARRAVEVASDIPGSEGSCLDAAPVPARLCMRSAAKRMVKTSRRAQGGEA